MQQALALGIIVIATRIEADSLVVVIIGDDPGALQILDRIFDVGLGIE
jgi:hypothetical protein